MHAGLVSLRTDQCSVIKLGPWQRQSKLNKALTIRLKHKTLHTISFTEVQIVFLLYTDEDWRLLITLLGRSYFIFVHFLLLSSTEMTHIIFYFIFFWRIRTVIYRVPSHKSSKQKKISIFIFSFCCSKACVIPEFLITLQLTPLCTDL